LVFADEVRQRAHISFSVFTGECNLTGNHHCSVVFGQNNAGFIQKSDRLAKNNRR